MKKRYVIMAALAGVLSLGACVDSNESESIEAVHKAKAEQLAAIAELNNAQASAKKVAATAEAERIEAEAAAKKAQNEIDKVKVELEKVYLEEDKVARDLAAALLDGQKQELANALLIEQKKLEEQKNRLAADKAKWEGEIDDIKKGLALSEASLKVELAKIAAQRQLAANNLQQLIDNKDNVLKAQLEGLVNDYNTASDNLEIAVQALAGDKADLVKLQYQLEGLDEILAEKITQWEISIADWTTRQGIYETYVDADYEKVKAEKEAAEVVADRLEGEASLANTNVQNFRTTNLDVADNAYQNSEYVKCINKYATNYYQSLSGARFLIITGKEYAETGKLTYKLGDKDMEYPYWETQMMTVDKETFGYYIAYLKSLEATAKTALDAKVTAYNTAVTATAAAKKAWEEAAEADKLAKKTAYEQAITAMNNAKEAMDNEQSYYDSYKKDLTTVETDFAYLTGEAGLAEYKKVVDAWNVERKAYAELEVKALIAEYAYGKANAELMALTDLLGTKVDVAALIKNCEEQIALNQKYIDQAEYNKEKYDYKDENGNIYSDVNYKKAIEAAIVLMEDRIKAGELAVSAFEKKVTDIQAEIDALMNE